MDRRAHDLRNPLSSIRMATTLLGASSPSDAQKTTLDRLARAVTYGDASAPVTVTSAIAAGSFSIAVHNAGAAIPAPLQARLFEPMTRGTEANAGRSVGLGLYIVQEIARAHGGSVTLVPERRGRDDVPRHDAALAELSEAAPARSGSPQRLPAAAAEPHFAA